MIRTSLVSIFVALPLACSDPPADPPALTSAPEPAPLALRQGADIDPAVLDALERDQASPAGAAAAGLDLPLGEDRAPTRLPVPRVGLASTASFRFGDGRRGWITRLPVAEQLTSVAFGGGRVYAGGGFNTYAFFAMEAESGRLLWDRNNLEDNGPTAPIYLDDEVIFNTESCTLFVLDARTGRTRWKRYLGDPTLAQPAVRQGLVFASYPAEGAQRLGAMRIRDGRTVWSRAVDGELISAPVVAGGAVLATTIRGTLYRFDAASGARRWRRRLHATSAPWVADERIYIAAARGRAEFQLALDAATGRTVAVLRRSRARYLGDVPRDLQSWPKVWAFEGSRPLMFQGRLIDTMAGEVSATSPGGERLWRRRDGARRGRRSLTAPVVAGSQVVFASRRGRVYALDIDTGMTVWAYDVGRRLAASPVVARGWVYLSTVDGAIIALEAGDPALDGWHMWGGGPGHNGGLG